MPTPSTSRLASTAMSTAFGQSQNRSRWMRRGLCCVATFLISIIARQAVNSRFSLVTIGTLRATRSIQKRSRAAGMKSCNLRSTRASRACGSAATRFGLNAIVGTSFVNTNKNWMNRWKTGLCLSCAPIRAVRAAVDVLDVARAHQFTVARRRGQWEFLETPELKQATREIKSLGEALLVLSRSFAGHELLTP